MKKLNMNYCRYEKISNYGQCHHAAFHVLHLGGDVDRPLSLKAGQTVQVARSGTELSGCGVIYLAKYNLLEAIYREV